jgi:hypothetical protein
MRKCENAKASIGSHARYDAREKEQTTQWK